MELKHLIQRFSYRIEPKAEGGFIARATDPTVPPLEAPTREELQQKIQASLAAAMAEAFPGLKLPAESKQFKFDEQKVSASKSFVRNILPISYLKSRFSPAVARKLLIPRDRGEGGAPAFTFFANDCLGVLRGPFATFAVKGSGMRTGVSTPLASE
jgi:hypothetical protein